MLKIIAAIGSIQVLAILVGLIRSKIIALLLGPAGVGIISIVDQSAQLVAHVSAFSLPFAAVKFLSRSHSESFEAFKGSYSSLLRALFLLTTAGAALSLGITLWRPEVLGRELSAYRGFLLPALIGVPAIALHGFFSSVLASGQKPKASALLALTITLSLTVAATIGVPVGGILGLYWGNFLASLFIVVGVLVYLKRKLGLPLFERGHGIRKELQKYPDTVIFSLILYGSSFAHILSYFVVRFTVLTIFGEIQAGLLQATIALAGAINLIFSPVNGLYLTPILNRSIPKEEKMRAALEFQRALMVGLGVLAMPIVLFPEWLLVLLFSTAFLEVNRVVFLFVVAQCVVQLGGVYNALLIGFDDLKMYGMITFFGHLLLALLSWLLAARYGILGVGVASLISSVTIFLLSLGQLSLKHGFVIAPRLRYLMGYELLTLLLAGGINNYFDAWKPLVILSKFGLYFLFLISLLFFMRREEIKQLVRKIEVFRSRRDRTRWRDTANQMYQWIARTFFHEE